MLEKIIGLIHLIDFPPCYAYSLRSPYILCALR